MHILLSVNSEQQPFVALVLTKAVIKALNNRFGMEAHRTFLCSKYPEIHHALESKKFHGCLKWPELDHMPSGWSPFPEKDLFNHDLLFVNYCSLCEEVRSHETA